jgi:threonine/homoserine/homoserine lactone efflux protein
MLELFVLGFALAATPGPDFVLIVDHTLAHGRRAGYLALAGNRASLCLHLAFALLGLSAILVTSPPIYVAVRLLGAAYLVYLGTRKLLAIFGARRPQTMTTGGERISRAQAFRRGFFNNLLNPKVSLFFLSLFPQFTNPTTLRDSPGAAALSFFVGNSALWVPLVALVGMPQARARITRFQRGLDLLFGLLFIGFGTYAGLRLVSGSP